MGKLLKANVNAVQANIQKLYSKLANLAFLTAQDKSDAAPTSLDWQVPKKTLTITNNLANSIVSYNGSAVSGSVMVDAGDTIDLLVSGATGYEISSCSASGATVIDNNDGTFTVRVKVNNDMSLTITGTAVVVVVVGITTSNVAGALGLSNTSAQQGGSYSGQITFVDDYYNQFEITSVKDASNNDVAYTLNENTITIANVPSDITITAIAKKQLKVWFGKTLNIFGGMETADATECVTDFIRLSTLVSDQNCSYNNGGLLRKGSFPLMNDNRCLVFYNKNKRLLYWAGQYEIKRVPSYISADTTATRTINSIWLGSLFSAAGANTPVYARATFGCSGTTINSSVSLKQNNVELLDLSNYAATNDAVTQHTLSYTLSNATVDNVQVPTVFPHNQPLEVSFAAASGYTLNNSNIVVTMGGQTLTQGTDYTVFTTGSYKTVRIENVTGDVNFNVSIS